MSPPLSKLEVLFILAVMGALGGGAYAIVRANHAYDEERARPCTEDYVISSMQQHETKMS